MGIDAAKSRTWFFKATNSASLLPAIVLTARMDLSKEAYPRERDSVAEATELITVDMAAMFTIVSLSAPFSFLLSVVTASVMSARSSMDISKSATCF